MKNSTGDRKTIIQNSELCTDVPWNVPPNSEFHSKWHCVNNCGACCHLDPTERPDLESYLTPEELELYLSMVGEDGWCVNYDRTTRKCRIYEQRPRFCRVEPKIFEKMYDVTAAEFDEFAISCCHEQIAGVYGEDSPELQRYWDELH